MKLLCLLLLLLLLNVVDLLPPADANQLRTFDWILEEARYTNTRRILTVNGRYPGPAIKIQQGDRVQVNIDNQGVNEVAFKWKGLKTESFENETKRLIKPGEKVTYEITLPIDQGTLWWLADSPSSYATVYGPILIYPHV